MMIDPNPRLLGFFTSRWQEQRQAAVLLEATTEEEEHPEILPWVDKRLLRGIPMVGVPGVIRWTRPGDCGACAKIGYLCASCRVAANPHAIVEPNGR